MGIMVSNFWGGAYKMLEYANKKKKSYINLGTKKKSCDLMAKNVALFYHNSND